MSNIKDTKEEQIHKPKIINPNPKNRVFSGGYDFQTTESLKYEGKTQKEEKISEIKLNISANSYFPKNKNNELNQNLIRNPNMNNIMIPQMQNFQNYQNYQNNNYGIPYYQNYNGINNNNNFNEQTTNLYVSATSFNPKKKIDVTATPYIPKQYKIKEEEKKEKEKKDKEKNKKEEEEEQQEKKKLKKIMKIKKKKKKKKKKLD